MLNLRHFVYPSAWMVYGCYFDKCKGDAPVKCAIAGAGLPTTGSHSQARIVIAGLNVDHALIREMKSLMFTKGARACPSMAF